MTFDIDTFSYDRSAGNTILDYQVKIANLHPKDTILTYGDSGNYSIAGFKMILTRNVAKLVSFCL